MKRAFWVAFAAMLALTPTAHARGWSIDPNGTSLEGLIDAGSSMDPNGDGLDSRGTLDPDGAGSAMDPNGRPSGGS